MSSETIGPRTIIIKPEDAEAYLQPMDIDVTDIRHAIEEGEIAAGNIDNYHPLIAAGMERWIHTVGGVRRRLSRGDWKHANPRNRPVSDHTRLPYSLSSVGANEVTGIIDHPLGPLAARRKGIGTAEAVTSTIPLISVEALRKQSPSVVKADAPPPGNWFLLYYRADDEVRQEISLPSGFEDGQFTGWQVRVILRSWGVPDPSVRKPLDVGGQDVDFQVSEAV